MLGVNPAPMLLSPLQRRPLQPCRVLGRVAGRWAEHHDAHSLLGLPALWRDDRSWPGKGTDTQFLLCLQDSDNFPPATGLGLAVPCRCGGAASARRSGAQLINSQQRLLQRFAMACSLGTEGSVAPLQFQPFSRMVFACASTCGTVL